MKTRMVGSETTIAENHAVQDWSGTVIQMIHMRSRPDCPIQLRSRYFRSSSNACLAVRGWMISG